MGHSQLAWVWGEEAWDGEESKIMWKESRSNKFVTFEVHIHFHVEGCCNFSCFKEKMM